MSPSQWMITGSRDLRQHAVIDLGVIVGAAAELCQRARSHQDDASAGLFDRRDLLFVGADHVVDGLGILDRQMIGAGAGKHQRIAPGLRRPRPSAGSVPARSASPAPCRAARCPWLRRRRGRGPRHVRGRRWSGPSRPPLSATDRRRRADRPPHAPRRTRRGSACPRASPGRSATPRGDRSRSSRRRRQFQRQRRDGHDRLVHDLLLTP